MNASLFSLLLLLNVSLLGYSYTEVYHTTASSSLGLGLYSGLATLGFSDTLLSGRGMLGPAVALSVKDPPTTGLTL